MKPELSHYEKLEPRQRRFVDAYCATLNAAEAARIAGYKAKANVIGAENLAKLSIREAIRERLSYFEMGPAEIKARLQALTASDMTNFLTISKKKGETTARLDLQKAKERGALHQIRKIKLKDGQVESLELHDSIRALALLAQIHELINPKEEDGRNPDNDIELRWDDQTSRHDPSA